MRLHARARLRTHARTRLCLRARARTHPSKMHHTYGHEQLRVRTRRDASFPSTTTKSTTPPSRCARRTGMTASASPSVYHPRLVRLPSRSVSASSAQSAPRSMSLTRERLHAPSGRGNSLAWRPNDAHRARFPERPMRMRMRCGYPRLSSWAETLIAAKWWRAAGAAGHRRTLCGGVHGREGVPGLP